jgi:hypothetical protein
LRSALVDNSNNEHFLRHKLAQTIGEFVLGDPANENSGGEPYKEMGTIRQILREVYQPQNVLDLEPIYDDIPTQFAHQRRLNRSDPTV